MHTHIQCKYSDIAIDYENECFFWKDVEDSVEADRRRLQGGAADMVNGGAQKEQQREKDAKKDKNEKHAKHDAKRDAKHDAKHDAKQRSGKLGESKDKSKRDRHGPCAAEALDEEVLGGTGRAMPSKSRSPARILKSSPEPEKVSAPEPVKPVNPKSSDSDSESSGERRRKRREHAGLKAASGFGLAPSEPQLSLGELFASLSSWHDHHNLCISLHAFAVTAFREIHSNSWSQTRLKLIMFMEVHQSSCCLNCFDSS